MCHTTGLRHSPAKTGNASLKMTWQAANLDEGQLVVAGSDFCTAGRWLRTANASCTVFLCKCTRRRASLERFPDLRKLREPHSRCAGLCKRLRFRRSWQSCACHPAVYRVSASSSDSGVSTGPPLAQCWHHMLRPMCTVQGPGLRIQGPGLRFHGWGTNYVSSGVPDGAATSSWTASAGTVLEVGASRRSLIRQSMTVNARWTSLYPCSVRERTC